jgi:hypothetical protein
MRKVREKWFSKQQLVTGFVTGIAVFLLAGILQHFFGIFSPNSKVPTYKTPITSTQSFLFTADTIAISKVNPLAVGSAQCWIHSLATPRPDAFRCQLPSHIIGDPCFASYWDTKVIVCPATTWKMRDITYKLSESLPGNVRKELLTPIDPSITSRSSYIWAVKLVNGVTCFRLTGAGGGIENNPTGFICSNQAQTIGPIDTANGLWHVAYFSSRSSSGIEIGIAKAWS